MSLEIDEELLELTDRCIDDLSCLTDGTKCFCEVENVAAHEVFFVKTESALVAECPYAEPFGYSVACMCPVRKEIYRRYGI